MKTRLALFCLTVLSFAASAKELKNGSVTCERYAAGARFDFQCWASDGLTNGEGAVYVFLEFSAGAVRSTLLNLMKTGAIPPGICISFNAGKLLASAGGADRDMRACEFDQPGPDFPSAIAEEIVPAAEKLLGVQASRSPDLHFITGGSSGGHAAFNACWYRNDWFRRCYCSSPTLSNMRAGNQTMQLVRKAETRPIRAYLTTGTVEPDYFFGDSYFAAQDAVSALRHAGYEVRFDRFPHEGHCARFADGHQLGKVLTWLFEDWRTKPVSAGSNPFRVRATTVLGSTWEACDFKMPPPVREVRSTDGERVYSVSPLDRFVRSERVGADGTRDRRTRLAPLELRWDATRLGGTALALAADDRLWVATEVGVQGVVSFGLTDVVLPLPGDLPCDNVALVGTTLYASSGERVFRRTLKTGAADPSVRRNPGTPRYGDGTSYMREHEPAGSAFL